MVSNAPSDVLPNASAKSSTTDNTTPATTTSNHPRHPIPSLEIMSVDLCNLFEKTINSKAANALSNILSLLFEKIHSLVIALQARNAERVSKPTTDVAAAVAP